MRGRNPACAHAPSSIPPDARATWQADQRAIAQLGQRNARAVRGRESRIVRGDSRDQGFVDQDLERNARWGLRVREPDHGHVEFPLAQRGEHPLRGFLGQSDLHPGVVRVEAGQHGGQVELMGRCGRPRDEAEGDLAAEQPGELVGGLADRLDGADRGPRVRQYGLAHLRQGHRPAGAVEQQMPELLLQLPDLGADPRLCQVQPGGGAGEVGFLRDRDEVPQLPNVHNQSF
ncbi:hypothetical protein GCM10010433_09620 [Streptomyces pulveraceus]